MFTSRAERRLRLRQDSADQRLTPIAAGIGLADSPRLEAFWRRRAKIAEIAALMESRRITQDDLAAAREGLSAASLAPHLGESLSVALRDPSVAAAMDESGTASEFLSGFLGPLGAGAGAAAGTSCDPEIEAACLSAALDARYSGYVEKEERLAGRMDRAERMRIPSGLDYRAIPGLSREAAEALSATQPATIGQASRLPGVRKSDAALLYVVLSRKSGKETPGTDGPAGEPAGDD